MPNHFWQMSFLSLYQFDDGSFYCTQWQHHASKFHCLSRGKEVGVWSYSTHLNTLFIRAEPLSSIDVNNLSVYSYSMPLLPLPLPSPCPCPSEDEYLGLYCLVCLKPKFTAILQPRSGIHHQHDVQIMPHVVVQLSLSREHVYRVIWQSQVQPDQNHC